MIRRYGVTEAVTSGDQPARAGAGERKGAKGKA